MRPVGGEYSAHAKNVKVGLNFIDLFLAIL